MSERAESGSSAGHVDATPGVGHPKMPLRQRDRRVTARMVRTEGGEVIPEYHVDGAGVHSLDATAGEQSVVTPIGVDLGVRSLLVAAPAGQGAHVDETVVVDGDLCRALFDELGAVTTRLQAMDADTTEQEAAVFRRYYEWLTDELDAAIDELWSFAEQYDAPVFVLEDLGHRNRPLVECRAGDVEPGLWMLPAFQRRLAAHSRREGYSIEYVSRHGTTKECHACGEYGEEDHKQLLCENDRCPVDAVGRDRSAAVSIANRYDPGEN